MPNKLSNVQINYLGNFIIDKQKGTESLYDPFIDMQRSQGKFSSQTSKSSTKSSASNIGLECEYDELEPVRREVALWRAVIMQALLDCATLSKRTEDQLAKREAIEWFSAENQGFLTVCENACFGVEYVLKKAKKAIKKGCRWRNDVLKQKRINAMNEVNNVVQFKQTI